MILSVNTATPQFSIALQEHDGTVIAEYLMSREKGCFGKFMPAFQHLMANVNTDIQALQAVVVSIGPGSFTGLRVGLSAAKGLCQGLGIPIIGINTLAALAWQMQSSDLPVTPVLYSRKNEFFISQYNWDENHQLIQIMDPVAVRTKAVSALFESPSIFIGNDFKNQGPLLKEALGPKAHLAPAALWHIRASAVGSLGLVRFSRRDMDDPVTLAPIYLRPPDIRPNLGQVKARPHIHRASAKKARRSVKN